MFDKLKQLHIVVLLIIIVFTAGGNWFVEASANAQQNADIKTIKVENKETRAMAQKNKEDFIALTGQLQLNNLKLETQIEKVSEQNKKLDAILSKL